MTMIYLTTLWTQRNNRGTIDGVMKMSEINVLGTEEMTQHLEKEPIGSQHSSRYLHSFPTCTPDQ